MLFGSNRSIASLRSGRSSPTLILWPSRDRLAVVISSRRREISRLNVAKNAKSLADARDDTRSHNREPVLAPVNKTVELLKTSGQNDSLPRRGGELERGHTDSYV